MNAHIHSHDRHMTMHNAEKFTQRGYLVSRIAKLRCNNHLQLGLLQETSSFLGFYPADADILIITTANTERGNAATSKALVSKNSATALELLQSRP